MYTPSLKTNTQTSLFNNSKSSHIHITPSSIIPQQESIKIFNYTSIYRCPPSNIPIEILVNNTFNRFKRLCPRSYFILSSFQSYHEYIFLNTSTKTTHSISYNCRYNNRHWCKKQNLNQDSLQIQHSSSYLCSSYLNFQESNQLLKGYLAVESLLSRPIKKYQLLILTWPCSSYLSDTMFEIFPRFILIIIFILIDGCILFSFNYLFQELIDEKHQGITELLRLLSIHPLYNSLAWFLRSFILQLIINLFLILIFKIYFSYISIWFIILTFILWTIQVYSRSILIAHFFNSLIKASLWSWLIYFISFWLTISSSIELPIFLHFILSAWLPFYSIKRIFIIFIQININLGREKYLINEIIFIWLSMLIGILFIWILAFYFQQIRPGKYGIGRSWLWPLESIRNKRKNQNNIDINIFETSLNDQTTVRVNNLTKTYGRSKIDRQIAVDHISFTLENSRIYGLIGHNGSGKTTTMEMICGLLSCDCGRIEIHNKNLNQLQSSIGYCPQQDMLFSYLTVQEQLEFYSYIRSKGTNINNKQIQDLLIMMDMNKYKENFCHTLSSGMKRKLSILCAFIGDVNVIILGRRENYRFYVY
jgi:ABC-type transport system involved in cytochrome c biogenesis ATPase subunit